MTMKAKVYSCLFLIVAFAAPSPAQPDKRDMEKENSIWQELKNVAPASIESFKAATEALDKADYTESARLYQEVLKKAPQFDPALRRCGSALVESGRVDEGMAMLERAVQIKRSPENLFSLAQGLAFPGEGKEGSKPNKVRALELVRYADRRDLRAAGQVVDAQHRLGV